MALALAVLGLLAGHVVAPAAAGAQTTTDSAVTATVAAQINAIEADKAGRTPTQQKIDSHLIGAARQERGDQAVPGAPALRAGVEKEPDGRVLLDVSAPVSDRLAGVITRLGGSVVNSVARQQSLRVLLPVAQVEALAGDGDVRSIRPADRSRVNKLDPPATAQTTSKEAMKDNLAVAVQAQQAVQPVTVNSVGSAASEGDVTHKANVARNSYGVDGTGVRIGVLSDGVNTLAARQASGDLGPVTVLAGQAGSGDEGTAMLEIVHDLAPGAQLYFATANNGVASFAQNIRDLQAAGCTIIVDDVTYFVESGFQDGPIARAVNDVTAAGALYFSSAGNSGNLTDNTSSTWEGDFSDSGTNNTGGGTLAGGTLHDFDPTAAVAVQNAVTPQFGHKVANLFWSDPLGGSGNDYDLYLLNSAGTAIVDMSTNVQDGNDDPFEQISDFFSGERFLIFKHAGAASRFLALYLNGDKLARGTTGATRGHNGGQSTITVGATPASTAINVPGSPTGPFPSPFNSSNTSEVFTSDGPRRVFYGPTGTPFTPGNVSSTGGVLAQKPEITAADGVKTSTPGFIPFYGTSASAPHAAAIAGLLRQAKPAATTAQLKTALTSSAIDIEAAGVDRDTGAGIIMADAALAAIGATPVANLVADTRTVVPSSGDADPFIEPGETVDVTQVLRNIGPVSATNVTVTMTIATPLVTGLVTTASYGTIAAGATGSPASPLRFRMEPGCPCGTPIDLTLTVSYTGGTGAPTIIPVRVATGQPGPTTNAAYAGPTLAIPDNSATGASATISVGAIGRISSLTFSIDGTACSGAQGSTTVGLDHSWVGDLVGTLTSPAGTVVTLFSRPGGANNSANNFCNTVFDDSAATSIQSITSGGAPYTGSFRPVGSLASLAGEDAQGTWTLKVTDNAATDTGSIRAFSLHIATTTCDFPLIANPTISTQASPGNLLGAPVRDVATLAGGSSPTGTVTFRLFSNNNCSTQVFTSTNALAGLMGTSDWFTPAAAGTYYWTAAYSGDPGNNPATSVCNAPNGSVTLAPFAPPPFTRTITGDLLGPVAVNAGDSVLITGGARVVGSVTVNPGGALTVQNSMISGGLVVNTPGFLGVCGSKVSAPMPDAALSVSNSTVPIRIGDPAAGCAGNSFAGQVSLTTNLGLTFGANIVSNNATINSNGAGNTVIKANSVFGTLGCASNSPVPANDGQVNLAVSKTGQCAGL